MRPSPFAPRLTPYALRFTYYASLFTALVFAVMYFITALPRILYPYDLDFIEDSILMQAWRFAQGQPVYISPSIEFIPHIYMPLYIWLGGWLINLFGLSLTPLRVLSFVATLITTALIFYITRRETQQNWLAFVAAGLYLGGYRLSGFWYELARVDSLFVAISLIGLVIGVYAASFTGRLIAIFVLILAFFTKQTALAFGVCLLFYWWHAHRWQAFWLALLYAAFCLIAFYWIDQGTNSWFAYYVITSASGDATEIGRVFHYIGFELFGIMFGVSAVWLGASWLVWRQAGVGGLRREPWLLAIGAAALISGVGRASVGGNLNNLMPVYALLCLTPSLFWKSSQPPPSPQSIPRSSDFSALSAFSDSSSTKQLVVLGVLLLQFAINAYNPLRYIPTAEMRTSGNHVIDRIRSIDGEVLVMMHPYYAVLAGKEPAAQIALVWHDFYWQQVSPPADFVERISTHYYAAIISDESLFETDPSIQGLLRDYYLVAETLPLDQSPLSPVGLPVRPTLLYIPK
jgi:hypothetical protein